MRKKKKENTLTLRIFPLDLMSIFLIQGKAKVKQYSRVKSIKVISIKL